MLAIIQARMSSRRMPGKIMKSLCGKPMLQWTIERVLAAHEVDDLIIATSSEASDTIVEEFCNQIGVKCFRGSLHNVASRFETIVKELKVDVFVRVSGDSPIIDPGVIDHAVTLFNQSLCDLSTNVMIRTFPKGQSVEVLNAKKFFEVCEKMSNFEDLEHVTLPYYREPERFQIVNFTSGCNFGSVQLSVDVKEDFDLVEKIIIAADRQIISWEEAVQLQLDLVKRNA